MMDVFTDPGIEEVVLYTSSGVGKTSVIENGLAYHVDTDPCPILCVQPTDQEGKDWSKDQLAGMIRDTPALRAKVSEARGRRDDNTIAHKKFPGGYLKVVGANSPRGFRRITARVVLLDEIDGYPPTAGPEGDPLELAKRRTRNLWNKKIVMASTPTIKGISRIEREWGKSDQRHYFVPCPKCKFFQVLVFGPRSQFAGLAKGYFKINAENPAESTYVCGNCSAELTEIDKYHMIAHGEWRATNPGIKRIAGFHIWEAYSPFSTFEKIANDWLSKNKHRESLKTFINTTLGETWEEPDALTSTEEILAARKEKYVDCPEGVVILIGSVDVQGDRLECIVRGWGLNLESWLIDHKKFYYATPGGKEAWALLDDYLKTEFPLRGSAGMDTGVRLTILRTFVDTGYRATDIYPWTGARRKRGIYACKGSSKTDESAPLLGKISRTQAARKGAILVPIGVHIGKRMIYDNLDISEPGPGYVHMNQSADDEYLKQLCAEQMITKYTRDRIPHKVWVPKTEGGRNEALDLEVYNLACFRFLNANVQSFQKRLQERIDAHPAINEPTTAPKTTTTPIPPHPTHVLKAPRSLKRTWVQGWR